MRRRRAPQTSAMNECNAASDEDAREDVGEDKDHERAQQTSAETWAKTRTTNERDEQAQ